MVTTTFRTTVARAAFGVAATLLVPGCFTALPGECLEQGDCPATQVCVEGLCVSGADLDTSPGDADVDTSDVGPTDADTADADAPDVDDTGDGSGDTRPADADTDAVDTDAVDTDAIADGDTSLDGDTDADAGTAPVAPRGFVWIPPGSFVMGSPEGELGRDTDEQTHTVTLTAGFFASATELTQQEWTALSGGRNPSLAPGCGGDCPVEGVDWFSALAYANARSIADGYEPCYTLVGCDDPAQGWVDGVHSGCVEATLSAACAGYRLPTEAEWEYAARAGSVGATYGGELEGDTSRCDVAQPSLTATAWWCGNSAEASHAVALLNPNAWGLYDTLGNVWEWTWDAYATYPTGITFDPVVGVAAGQRPVIRGGSYSNAAFFVRAAYRNGSNDPVDWGQNLGLRLVRTPSDGQVPPVVQALAVSGIQVDQASLAASLVDPGTPVADAAGFCVGPAAATTCLGSAADAPCAVGHVQVPADTVPAGAGAIEAQVLGLEPSTGYVACAYATNAAGVAMTPPVAFVTPSAAPGQVTGVVASTTRDVDVQVSWTAVPGATGYEISIDGGAWTAVPLATTYTDTAAPVGSVAGCTVAASDGTSTTAVELACSPTPVATPGTDRQYRVRALTPGGPGPESTVATGRRSGGLVLVSWERSSGDAASGYTTLAGVTGAVASDATAAAGAGRYYRAVVTAGPGVLAVTTLGDRGLRGVLPALTAGSATAITASGATLGASLTALGSPSLLAAGFCVAPSGTASCVGPSPAEPCSTGQTQVVATPVPAVIGAFSTAVSGLSASSSYVYCAYATNAAGTVHTAPVAFATPAASLPLGAACDGDSDCGHGAWCPTDSTLRRCAPHPELVPGLTMPFQFVPGGTFLMGAPVEEVGRGSDETQVSVTLTRDYFVGRTEVTQGQWKALSGGLNPSCFQSTSGTGCTAVSANDNGPVEQIDWYSALAYANALSTSQGLTPCYTLTGCADPADGWKDGQHTGCSDATFVGVACSGYRLPTEAEWERAARAGTAGATYAGDLSGSVIDCVTAQPNLDPLGWWCLNAGNRTRAVGSRTPNAWGLYDMLGNLLEFGWDRYATVRAGGADPLGSATGTNRIQRGGTWYSDARHSRSAFRFFGSAPTDRFSYSGFRLVRSGSATALSLPSIAATATSAVTSTGATLGARVNALGSPSLTAAGFCVAPAGVTSCVGPTASQPCAAGQTQVVASPAPTVAGPFTNAASGLAASTRYAYCAYASNAVGTVHTAPVEFETAAGPGPTGELGGACVDDADCPAGTWCPTNTTQRFCAPRPTVAAGVTMPFQFVPSGTFTMGSPSAEPTREADEGQVASTISRGLFAGRTEVTQGQWKALSGGVNPSCFQSTTTTSCTDVNANDSGPVEDVDWYSALGFANAMSDAAGLDRCYALSGCNDAANGWVDGVHTGCTSATFVGTSCAGYRLPTEAEWEYVARAGAAGATPLGTLVDPTRDCTVEQPALDPVAWWCGTSPNRTQAVGGLQPNHWGLYDVLGNVWEWTWDRYASSLPGGVDPLVDVGATQRVLRGGSWYFFFGWNPRLADRYSSGPGTATSDFGFRLVRSVP